MTIFTYEINCFFSLQNFSWEECIQHKSDGEPFECCKSPECFRHFIDHLPSNTSPQTTSLSPATHSNVPFITSLLHSSPSPHYPPSTTTNITVQMHTTSSAALPLTSTSPPSLATTVSVAQTATLIPSSPKTTTLAPSTASFFYTSTSAQTKPGQLCLVCGDVDKGVPCTDMDLVLAGLTQCPDEKPYCMNDIYQRGRNLTQYRR